ncbi:MAG: hypothetical protein ACFCU4_08060 [Puniceicoccaceae bacterium]
MRAEVVAELRQAFLDDCKSDFVEAIKDQVIEEYIENERQTIRDELASEIYMDECDEIKLIVKEDAYKSWLDLTEFFENEVIELRHEMHEFINDEVETLRDDIIESIKSAAFA